METTINMYRHIWEIRQLPNGQYEAKEMVIGEVITQGNYQIHSYYTNIFIRTHQLNSLQRLMQLKYGLTEDKETFKEPGILELWW